MNDKEKWQENLKGKKIRSNFKDDDLKEWDRERQKVKTALKKLKKDIPITQMDNKSGGM